MFPSSRVSQFKIQEFGASWLPYQYLPWQSHLWRQQPRALIMYVTLVAHPATRAESSNTYGSRLKTHNIPPHYRSWKPASTASPQPAKRTWSFRVTVLPSTVIFLLTTIAIRVGTPLLGPHCGSLIIQQGMIIIIASLLKSVLVSSLKRPSAPTRGLRLLMLPRLQLLSSNLLVSAM